MVEILQSEKEKAIQRMDELCNRRKEVAMALAKLNTIEQYIPLPITILSLGLVAFGVYLSMQVERPEAFHPMILVSILLMVAGAVIFYYSKFKIDRKKIQKTAYEAEMEEINNELKQLSQQTGKKISKLKYRKNV